MSIPHLLVHVEELAGNSHRPKHSVKKQFPESENFAYLVFSKVMAVDAQRVQDDTKSYLRLYFKKYQSLP